MFSCPDYLLSLLQCFYSEDQKQTIFFRPISKSSIFLFLPKSNAANLLSNSLGLVIAISGGSLYPLILKKNNIYANQILGFSEIYCIVKLPIKYQKDAISEDYNMHPAICNAISRSIPINKSMYHPRKDFPNPPPQSRLNVKRPALV